MKKAIQQQGDGFELSILVEDDIEIINPKTATADPATAGSSLKKLTGSLDDLAQAISTTCARIENKIDKMNEKQERKSKISELTIEFGLSLTAEANVIITKAGGGATLNISAKLKFD